MTIPTNAPMGANAPALSVVWTSRQLDAPPGAGRVTLLTAQIEGYTLEIHDATGSNGGIHIVMWSVTDRGKRLAEGVVNSPETAKVAAEQEARRLLDALPAGSEQAAPPQPSCPPKELTPQSFLRGSVTEATSLFPILWQDKSAAPKNHTVELAITGPFYLDIIDYHPKYGPETGRRFGWFVCGLLRSGFLADGEDDSREAAKAAAEKALHELVADDPGLLVMDTPDLGDRPSHAAALAAVRADYEQSQDIWDECNNDERREADLAVVAQRCRKALAAAGPLFAIDDATALEQFHHELWEVVDLDPFGLAGARGVMLKAIAGQLEQFPPSG